MMPASLPVVRGGWAVGCSPGATRHRGEPSLVRSRRRRAAFPACPRASSNAVFDWERTDREEADLLSKVGSKVKNESPFLGLFTRLISPQGTSSLPLTYNEFSRCLFDKASSAFHIAAEDLEKVGGEIVGVKGCIYCLWCAVYGAGYVKRADLLQSATRLRLNEDLEFFIELFEYQRSEAFKATRNAEPPTVAVGDRIDLAVDMMCRLLGVKGDIGEDVRGSVLDAIVACFPGSGPDAVAASMDAHAQRAAGAKAA